MPPGAEVGKGSRRTRAYVEPHEVNPMEKAATNLRGRLLVRPVFSDKLGQFWAVSYREMQLQYPTAQEFIPEALAERFSEYPRRPGQSSAPYRRLWAYL
jgi:hypothetical protein